MQPAETRPRHGARGSLQTPNGQAYSFVAGVDEARRAHVTDRLRAFNEAHLATDHDREPLETYVLDDDGRVVGGLIGGTIWGWLEVAVLWIDVPLRGQGLGTELMRRAEQEAVERGCTAARLSTWDFQALEFYRRLGYLPCGRLDEYPPGHSVHHLRKELSA
jgi:ribosomal protein S18 acetylase RimI-like enzyme